MTDGMCMTLATAVNELGAVGVPFALVHESALMGWGIDNSVFLSHVDALIIHNSCFAPFGRGKPQEIGEYIEVELGDVPVRLWSRDSLGIRGGVEVTSCARYGCDALAPEIVLTKLPYSPDAPMLMEQRAQLAAILMANELTDEEIALAARYVRGI